MRRSIVAALGCGLVLAGCASAPDLPKGEAAYRDFPPPRADGALAPYQIGPFDKISVTVFQEPDLSLPEVQVDAGGKVLLPLIGQLSASGKTATQLATAIARRLGQRFLENPQVSVIVQESVSQKVTVQGSVSEPGVYEIQGRTTLLDAVAMAKGTTRVAALNNAVIFRDINGQRVGALFNLKQITRGEALDPEILGNDVVVIGLSNIKAAWRDVLTAAPLVAAARPF